MAKTNEAKTNKVAIVTGSATGLGAACAIDLAGRGWNVAINYTKSKKEADETYAAVKAKGVDAILVQADMGQDADCRKLAAETMAKWGRIDGLVNTAAYFREVKLTPFEDIESEIWDRAFDVNVKGVWHCCKAVMPAMRAQQSGAIVNIASVVAVAGQPGYLHYVATKGAVLAMTKALAKECGNINVRVNVIAPGFVITDATKNRPVEWHQSFLKARALSREQRPQDLVGTAVYLLSDMAGFVSGQTIVVDGGSVMY